ncbi:MAG: Maf family protein [bacterium]
MTLYLASQSPRRALLIKLLGITDVVVSPSNIEEVFDYSESPSAIVQDLAYQKAAATLRSLGEGQRSGVVLGADTIVVLGDRILGKPLDKNEAVTMLADLSGKTHSVFTGVVLLEYPSGKSLSFFEKTDVTFRTLDSEEILNYVNSGAPMDKAGAYGIQEDQGAVFVKKIVGDYYNVVGLPICSLYEHLRHFAPKLF